jgi:hypothetical protein
MKMSTTITLGNLDLMMADRLPTDMAKEIMDALQSGQETSIEYQCTSGDNQQPTHYVYFPNAMRGGVCGGGSTEWTDCDGLEDLQDRWESYAERWTN